MYDIILVIKIYPHHRQTFFVHRNFLSMRLHANGHPYIFKIDRLLLAHLGETEPVFFIT